MIPEQTLSANEDSWQLQKKKEDLELEFLCPTSSLLNPNDFLKKQKSFLLFQQQ